MASETRRRSSAVSLGNWMWTLFLNGTIVFDLFHILAFTISYELLFDSTVKELWKSVCDKIPQGGIWYFAFPAALVFVPIVSLILWIVTTAASKKVSKRKWALANIIWLAITFVLVILAIVFFGDKILDALVYLSTTPVTQLGGAQ